MEEGERFLNYRELAKTGELLQRDGIPMSS